MRRKKKKKKCQLIASNCQGTDDLPNLMIFVWLPAFPCRERARLTLQRGRRGKISVCGGGGQSGWGWWVVGAGANLRGADAARNWPPRAVVGEPTCLFFTTPAAVVQVCMESSRFSFRAAFFSSSFSSLFLVRIRDWARALVGMLIQTRTLLRYKDGDMNMW